MRTCNLSAVVLLGAGFLIGCDGAISPEGRKLLLAAGAAYQRGDDPQTIQSASRFLQIHPRCQEAGEAYYLRGLARSRSIAPEAGKDDLTGALRFTRRKDLTALVHAKLGELAFTAGQMPQAETHYRAVLQNARPGASPSDEAMYRLGCILQQQGRWREADAHFDRMIHLFDGTELAKRAAQRVRATRWSIQVGAFRTADAARALEQKLRAAGLNVRVDPDTRGQELVRLVRVGSYRTHDAAGGDLAKVQAIRPDAFLVPAR
jgi:tetratricopeptide (TPR) repeat protein